MKRLCTKMLGRTGLRLFSMFHHY